MLLVLGIVPIVLIVGRIVFLAAMYRNIIEDKETASVADFVCALAACILPILAIESLHIQPGWILLSAEIGILWIVPAMVGIVVYAFANEKSDPWEERLRSYGIKS